MSLNWTQFHAGVVKPALLSLEPTLKYSRDADVLVSETIWHESDRLRALGQYPRFSDEDLDATTVRERPVFGPGLGVAMIERPTWDWMVTTELGKKTKIPYGWDYEDLAWDLRLNVIACRLRYALDPAPLPSGKRTEAALMERSAYWGKVYQGRSDPGKMFGYRTHADMIPWQEWPSDEWSI